MSTQPPYFSVLPSGLDQSVDACGNLIDATGTTSQSSYTNSNFDTVTGTPMEMSLVHFDKIVSIGAHGDIYETTYTPVFSDYDAIADLDVSLANFRKIFAIGSDSIDLSNIAVFDPTNPDPIDNVRFYVYDDKIDNFNPLLGANSVVTNSAIQTISSGHPLDQHVKRDFVRYLAYLLFNTSKAGSLFLNENELVNSVSDSLDAAWAQCAADLHSISTSGNSASLTVSAAGNYYTDVSGGDLNNICGELYKQIVSRQPQRFSDLKDLRVLSTTEPDYISEPYRNHFYLPLIAGDTIDIKVTVHPNENQTLYGLTPAVAPNKFGADHKLIPRVYLIRMTLV